MMSEKGEAGADAANHRWAALVTDLIFATKIRSTAEAVGASVELTRTADGLRGALAGGVRRVLIDLNAERVDPVGAIRAARDAAGDARIIAYVSHVQAELGRSAKEAGADEVLARSEFATRLPDILAGR